MLIFPNVVAGLVLPTESLAKKNTVGMLFSKDNNDLCH